MPDVHRTPPLKEVKETPTPRKKLQPFVELPPLPKIYQTPTSQRSERWSSHTPSQRSKGKSRADEDDDLGGFGSEDDVLPAIVKSSGRRATGDRDDRGLLLLTTLESFRN